MQPPRGSRSFEAAVGVAGYAALMAAWPAGRPPWLYHDPSPPIWNVLLVVSPFALALIALGIGLRRFGADRKLGQRLASSPKG